MDRYKKIKLIVLDVDGVMTDAGLMVGHDGFEYMKFNVQDGAGIILAVKMGFRFAIITGRNTDIIEKRARMLHIEDVYQNQINKMPAYLDLLKKRNLKDEEVCYMADDILDIPILKRVGFAVVPKNAVPEAKKYAHFITKRNGGEGAVREMIDLLMMKTGRHARLMKQILAGEKVGMSV